ncbi:MAG: hypothetical protein KatS3mg132_470 [Limisphaera sp.]|nr:MAG: hypothetical protein KatS3mg132_470 [Limisphaera sp.]
MWLGRQRMVVARQWLGGGRRAGVVAEGLGYACVRAFSRAEREWYGCSPRANGRGLVGVGRGRNVRK